MTSRNSVTIYQNGIAAFERTIDISGDKATRLNLPLRTEHLGDFLNTFRVLGENVKLSEPPTYAPEKQKPALMINSSSVTKDLFKGLSGADLTLSLHNKTMKGKVMGTDTETTTSATGTKTEDLFVNIMAEDHQLLRYNLRTDITSFTFTDETIQADIEKALAYNLEQTKPGNTFVALGLTATKPSVAALHYAIPTAAWKLTYRLIGGSENWALDGLAVVDNPTDEDWKDFTVTVATGSPVTFGTDLAKIRLPNRSNVNLVSDNAVGAVEVESGFESAGGAPRGAPMAKGQSYRNAAPVRAYAADANSLQQSASGTADSDYWMPNRPAETTQAEISDVGAFSVFRSELPMTIPARKSGLVPLFNQKLSKASAVLYYGPDRANLMRAVLVENDSTFTFGRGSCSVEEGGVHVGSAVLSLTKPGQSAMLCHAVESGVKILAKVLPVKENITKVNLADGILLSERKFSQTTSFEVKPTNTYDGPRVLVVDYTPSLAYSEITVYEGDAQAKILEKLSNGGVRIQCVVEEDAGTQFKVIETKIDKQSVKAENVTEWLITNPTCPLLKDAKLSKFRTLAEELATLNSTLGTKKAQLTQLANTQDRVRKNLEALKGDSTDFKNKLMNSEVGISVIEAELPKLEERKAALIHQLRAVVAATIVDWKE